MLPSVTGVYASCVNWRRRLRQWAQVIRMEHGSGARIPWRKMIIGILAPVPRRVWRERLRYGCYRCPIFDLEFHRCRGVPEQIHHLGCGCFVVFGAMSPEPYVGGCWGRATFGGEFGWGAYRFPSLWRRLTAFPRFLLRR